MIFSNVNTLTLNDPCYPEALKHITGPPAQLFYVGENPQNWLYLPKLAVVGSRKISNYGKQVTTRLAAEAAQAGAVVISGLAFGVDATAHQAALGAGGTCVAVLPTPLSRISPVGNQQLARKIIAGGGTLISEYANDSKVFKTNFVARNRIVSGLCDVLLITEAAVNSGSLHTARFALEQGKTVMAVPGNITSPVSEGCNNLIKSGAIPVTNVSDLLFALKIHPNKKEKVIAFSGSKEEELVLELISQGVGMQEEIAMASNFDSPTISNALTMLEIRGLIRSLGAGNWTIA